MNNTEEYKKFGEVIRLEYLRLPMFDDEKEYFEFVSSDGMTITLCRHVCNLKYNDCITVEEFSGSNFIQTIYSAPDNRENYDKAREICIKLFGGNNEQV